MEEVANTNNQTEKMENDQEILGSQPEETKIVPQSSSIWKGKYKKDNDWVEFTLMNMEFTANGTVNGKGSDQNGEFLINGLCSQDGSISLSQQYAECSNYLYQGKIKNDGIIVGKMTDQVESFDFILEVDQNADSIKDYLQNINPTYYTETSDNNDSLKLNKKKKLLNNNKSEGSLFFRNDTQENNSSSIITKSQIYGNRLYPNQSSSTLHHSIQSYTIPKQSRFDKSMELKMQGSMYNIKSTLTNRGTC